MNKFKNKKIVISLAIAAIAIFIPLVSLAGYEPANRPVKSYNGPDTPGFTYPVFNSWINTNYGDERAFYDASVNNTNKFADQTVVKPGDTVTLRMYVHNGANPGLNDTGEGIARNTRVQVYLPTATSTQLRSFSYIIADNTNPKWVADSADLTSSVPVSLEYVAGSATLSNRANPNGVKLSDAIVQNDKNFNPDRAAAPIGYDKMDGNYPGCFEFASFITLQVKVKGPGLDITKQVTTQGSNEWRESVNAKPGEQTAWLINYKNNSQSQVNNIVVRDTLPAHLSVVPGSVMVFDSNRPNGQQLSDTGLFSGGVNVGSLGVNGGGYIRFKTKINDDFKPNECGNQTLTNIAEAEAQGVDKKKDTASVVVPRECVPVTPVTPTGTLPQTGGAIAFAGLAGSAGLGMGASAYRKSKRDLIAALRKNH